MGKLSEYMNNHLSESSVLRFPVTRHQKNDYIHAR